MNILYPYTHTLKCQDEVQRNMIGFFCPLPPTFGTGSHSVILTHLDPSDLELTEITASAFQMLTLKVCALTPDYH